MKNTISALSLFAMLAPTAIWGQDRPNIILFLVDDMGVMDTSVPFLTDSLGQPQVYPLNHWYRTPNMERLANQGIRFSLFYAQSVSSPSRTSILTGQNAARHRTTNWINAESNNRTPYGPLDWNWKGIAPETPVYPKLLQQAGYKTIHVGKAHFGCLGSYGENPEQVGFDVNIAGSAIGHPGSYYGENGYGWLKGNHARAVPDLEKYHGTSTFLTEALTLEACAQIEQAVKEGKPFYLNMAHYAVHAPFEADPRFTAHYADSEKPRPAQAFASLIEGMDKSLGDLMDKLQQLGVAENTLILFLGDNGGDAPLGEAGEHGACAPLRGKKGSEYEGGMRVPFLAAWAMPDPENVFQKKHPIAVHAVQSQMATVMDIYPTVLSVAGVKKPRHYALDGDDLSTLLEGKRDRGHRDDFLMHFPHAHRGSYFTVYRQGDWKLIYYYMPKDPEHPQVKLYHLSEDPFENRDVSCHYPKVVRSLFHDMQDRLEKEKACYPVNRYRQPLRPFLPEYFESAELDK